MTAQLPTLKFERTTAADRLAKLATRGIYVGTSSWKYPGWMGQLYEEQRYLTRGRFSHKKFEAECLAEYADVFRTVCLDASFYQFPTPESLGALLARTGPGFLLSMKVTDAITIRRFPKLPRFGTMAGKENPHFLDATLFREAFLGPCEPICGNLGAIIFEFSPFHAGDFARGREFVEMLDGFLAKLPSGWPYAVEIRNSSFLHPEYFAALRRHGVAHVYNQWARMPPALEQMAIAESATADFLVARFQLTPGRAYADAVKAFKPYTEVQAPDPAARQALGEIVKKAGESGQKAFAYVNNRLEGNSLGTIASVLLGDL